MTATEASDTYIGTLACADTDDAPAEPEQSFLYTKSTSGVTIRGLVSGFRPEHLRIPRYIDGSPVVEITADAFKNNTALISITLPEELTTLNTGAFQGCTKLEQIDLSLTGLSSLPDSFASGDVRLGRVLLPACKLVSIGNSAFSGCVRLNKAKLSSDIGSYAFNGCTDLSQMLLAGGVKSIGTYAFRNCTGLTELTVPDSVNTLGTYFLQGCTAIVTLDLEPSIETLTAAQLNIP